MYYVLINFCKRSIKCAAIKVLILIDTQNLNVERSF